jgi:DNA repair exonuclease SbcCD ATPase subunit
LNRLERAENEAAKLGEYSAADASAREEYAELARRLEVLRRARELLTRAKENLSGSYLKPLCDGFTKYLNAFGEDGKFMIDTDLVLNIESGGKIRPLGFFSAGTREMLDICMRLALVETLFKNEPPFVILDDPFTNLDERKLRGAKRLVLKLSGEYQIIYFTCHGSRMID